MDELERNCALITKTILAAEDMTPDERACGIAVMFVAENMARNLQRIADRLDPPAEDL